MSINLKSNSDSWRRVPLALAFVGTMVAGLFTTSKVESHRTEGTSFRLKSVSEENKTFARSWEDPFEAVTALENEDLILPAGDGEGKSAVLLTCLVPDSGLPAMVEMRIRTRHALTMAAYESDYVPSSPDNLFYIRAPREVEPELESSREIEGIRQMQAAMGGGAMSPEDSGNAGSRRLLGGNRPKPPIITYEVFHLLKKESDQDVAAGKGTNPKKKQELLIIAWVPSGHTDSEPLKKLKEWTEFAQAKIPQCLGLEKHLVLGPPSSGQLTKITKEVLLLGEEGAGAAPDSDSKPEDATQSQDSSEEAGSGKEIMTIILSPWATVDQKDIIDAAWAQASEPKGWERKPESLEEIFQKDFGYSFISTVRSDGDLMAKAIHEIRLRHAPDKKELNVLLIGDMTGQYGRYWIDEDLWHELGRGCPFSGPAEIRVRGVIPYQRGIDASLYSTSKVVAPEQDLYAPIGLHQADYLIRRLQDFTTGAGFLPKEQLVDAIVVTGADIYDKMMLIALVKPLFPGTLIVTPDYDERLAQEGVLASTQNLLVVSQNGPKWEVGKVDRHVDDLLLEAGRGKWRYWAQYAIVSAAMAGLNPADAVEESLEANEEQKEEQVAVLEVGLTGFVPYPSAGDSWDFIPALLITTFMIGALLLVGLFGLLFRWSKPSLGQMQKDSKARHEKWRKGLSLTIFILSAALWVYLSRIIRNDHANPNGEMWSLTRGISVWPTISIRVFLGFALLMTFLTLVLRSIWLFEAFPVGGRNEKVESSGSKRRWIFVLAVPISFGILLYWLEERGAFPGMAARGHVAQGWLKNGTILCVMSMILVVSWLAYDCHRCGQRLERMRKRLVLLVRRHAWGGSQEPSEKQLENRKELRRELRGQLEQIGHLTCGITYLVSVPAIAFAVMVVVRARYFDGFAWNAWYVGTMTVPPILLLGSLFLLRLAAHRTRHELLTELDYHQSDVVGNPKEEETMRWARGYVHGFHRGAFCPWVEDPLFKVILVPVTILGSLGYLKGAGMIVP